MPALTEFEQQSTPLPAPKRAELALFGVNWSAKHADFIRAYNRSIETEGLALDEWGNF